MTKEVEEILNFLFRDITKKRIMDTINSISKGVQDDTADDIYNKILSNVTKKEILDYIKKKWNVYEIKKPFKIC